MSSVASRPASVSAEKPTRVRYGVLAFACSLSMITYLDRVCFGAAGSNLVADLNLSNISDLKWAFTAFAFAYAVFEVPSGWLGDVYGPRRTLIRIVLWWSFFTAVTGMVGMKIGAWTMGGVGLLIVIRFLFGMGEAGAYPNITRSLHNWFPFQERGFAQGMVWMSGRLMGGLTPLIWALLVAGITSDSVTIKPVLEWRGAFWLFGVLGVAWTVAFALWFRNRPSEKATVNASERALIEAGETQHDDHANVPWGKLFRSGNLWALCLMYFCAAYGWYFNITYLPNFLEEQYGVSKTSFIGSIYKGGPLMLGAAGCLIGGFLTDAYIRRTGNRRLGRRLFGIIGHILCAICYMSCIWMPDALTFFLAISFAAFFNDLTMGSAWATCQDIGGRYSAIVAGCMNMIGNLGGAVAGFVTGYILELCVDARADKLNVAITALSQDEKLAGLRQGYHIAFISFACVYAIAVFCWLRIDASKRVTDES